MKKKASSKAKQAANSPRYHIIHLIKQNLHTFIGLRSNIIDYSQILFHSDNTLVDVSYIRQKTHYEYNNEELYEVTTLLFRNYLMLLGGEINIGCGGQASDVRAINLLTKQFTSFPSMILPRIRFGAANIDNHKIVVAGGKYDAIIQNAAEIFEYEKNEWKELPKMEEARVHCGIIYVKPNKVYVIGGLAGKSQTQSESIEMMNLSEQKKWRFMKASVKNFIYAMPIMVIDNSTLFVSSAQNKLASTLYKFDHKDSKITEVKTFKSSEVMQSSIIIDDKIHIHSSIDDVSVDMNNWSIALNKHIARGFKLIDTRSVL